MKSVSASACAIIMSLLAGCSQPPADVAVDSLVFPVVQILRTSAAGQLSCHARIVEGTASLSKMRLETYSKISDRSISDPPIVIDGTAKTLDMKNIIGERGGLWMMVNPTGLMPIRFTLSPRRDTGIAVARSLISNCRYLGRDLDNERTELRRDQIRLAHDMARIVEILDDRYVLEKPGTPAPRR